MLHSWQRERHRHLWLNYTWANHLKTAVWSHNDTLRGGMESQNNFFHWSKSCYMSSKWPFGTVSHTYKQLSDWKGHSFSQKFVLVWNPLKFTLFCLLLWKSPPRKSWQEGLTIISHTICRTPVSESIFQTWWHGLLVHIYNT